MKQVTTIEDSSADSALLVFAALIFIGALAWHVFVPLPSDVSYLLLCAGRILDGDVPYRDFLETNPPLIMWLNVPVVSLARLTGISPQVTLVSAIGCLIIFVLYLTNNIAASAGLSAQSRRRIILPVSIIMAASPAGSFGQREHIVAILLLPYIFAATQLAGSRPSPSRPMRCAIGLAAGLAVAFKPYFLLLPLMVELGVQSMRQDWRLFFRIETVLILLSALIYPVVVWIAAPDYLTTILPLAVLTYDAYDIPLIEQLGRQFTAITGGLLILAGLAALHYSWHREGLVFLFAAVAGFAMFLVQSKGFAYHLLPSFIFGAVSIVVGWPYMTSRALQSAAVILLACSTLLLQVMFRFSQSDRIGTISALFEDRERGSVMAFTHDLGVLFPFVEHHEMGWKGHFQSFWMMPSVSKSLLSPADSDAVVRRTAETAARDLDRANIRYVIVDNRANTSILRGYQVEYIRLFSTVPEFARTWARYQKIDSAGPFDLWSRRPELSTPNVQAETEVTGVAGPSAAIIKGTLP